MLSWGCGYYLSPNYDTKLSGAKEEYQSTKNELLTLQEIYREQLSVYNELGKDYNELKSKYDTLKKVYEEYEDITQDDAIQLAIELETTKKQLNNTQEDLINTQEALDALKEQMANSGQTASIANGYYYSDKCNQILTNNVVVTGTVDTEIIEEEMPINGRGIDFIKFEQGNLMDLGYVNYTLKKYESILTNDDYEYTISQKTHPNGSIVYTIEYELKKNDAGNKYEHFYTIECIGNELYIYGSYMDYSPEIALSYYGTFFATFTHSTIDISTT